MTVKTLKRSVEKMFETLSPEEKAKYLSDEWWRVCDEAAIGNDVAAKIADLRQVEKKYVMSLHPMNFIKYCQENRDLDLNEWARRYFCAVISGFEREKALISLLRISTEREYRYESIKPEDQRCKTWKDDLNMLDDRIELLNKRENAIKKEMDNILAADFWDTNGIERPVYETRPEPDTVMGSR